MANRIRGITIEIAGDTTKLQKSLSGVDKSLRTTQQNLRDINKLLKLDPSNTELLTQKQKNLRQAISDTKDRLKQLKDAQSQVKQGTDDWDALQREIIATEQNLKGLEKEYKDFGSVAKQQLKQVSEKTKEVGKKMTSIGTGITKGVTAPIAAVGAASLVAFNEVDAGADIIIKKTGAVGESAEEMTNIMERLATTIPTDFETAGTAIGEVSTRFGVTGEELEELSGKFIKFAELNNTDVSSSIDAVQSAMAAFNVDTSDAGNVLDAFNKVGQGTGVSVDELAQNLLTNATAFSELGVDIKDAAGFLGNLEKNGVDSSAMLTGLKTALKNATKQGKPMNRALEELQTELEGSSTSTEAMQTAMELFGNKAGPAIAKAVSEGKLNLTDFSNSVTDWSGSVETTFDATLDPIDRFKTTLNELKIVGSEVGGTLMELLAPVLEKVAEGLRTIKEKWDGLSPETQNMIIKAALIAAAVGPIITLLGTLVTAIGALISPIGLVVAAIGGAVAAGVALYKNWGKIKETAGKVKEKVVEKWGQLKEGVERVTEPLRNNVIASWNEIKNGVTNAATNLKTNVSNAWSTLRTNVSNTLSSLRSNISEKWSSIKSGISEKVSSIATNVANRFGNIRDSIANKLSSAKTTALNVFNNIKDGITNKLSAARDFVKGAIDAIKGFFNFEWSLPHIPLPHFSISGKLSLNPPSVPHLSVDWWKKAYDTPYLFTTPTIIGGNGFGDGGGSGEIVYGRDQLLRDIATAKGGDEITINVYAREGMDVNRLADEIQHRLAFVQMKKAAVYA